MEKEVSILSSSEEESRMRLLDKESILTLKIGILCAMGESLPDFILSPFHECVSSPIIQ
jgi:hypothetical protein